MTSCNESSRRYFKIDWHIENFHFCWHKTGERLESPLFNINTPSKTSWRLWLYPRGEDDGEYISCCLFRAEGGPEVVDVDFSLSLFVRETPLKSVSFSKIYSFKSCQREGLKRFASRYEVLAPVAAQKDRFTLTLRFVISNPRIELCNRIMFTRIEMEHVYGSDIFDNNPDFDPDRNKSIEVKPILEDEPLININLSYVDESLVIKIHPVSCKNIKYATCKIIVIKNWERETPIEYVRSWIGEIKSDIWRCHAPCPEMQFGKPNVETFIHEAFFLYYDFAFSTGVVVVERFGSSEYDSYVKTSNIYWQQCLKSNIKTIKSVPTALDALRDAYLLQCYADVNLEGNTRTFPVHKAILWARCPQLKKSEALIYMEFSEANMGNFLLFLYTDAVEFLSLQAAVELYTLAFTFDVGLLKMKGIKFLIDNLNHKNIYPILCMVLANEDLALKTFVLYYFLTYYDLILSSANFEIVPDVCTKIRKEILLLKYKKVH